jgi:putative CRISPR-associated protein (TIGR02619 family)
MKILFITVGTSALTAQDLFDDVPAATAVALKEHVLNYCKVLRDDPQGQKDYERDEKLFGDILAVHRNHWKDWDENSNRLTTSAEMSSTSLLLADTKLLAPLEPQDRFVLLLSDTEICDLTGRLNAQLLHDICHCPCGADFKNGQTGCERVILLKVPKMDAAEGFKSLVTEIQTLIGRFQSGNAQFAFNITGGFKGAIPCITWVAMGRNYPLYYLHESQRAIIRVDFSPAAGGFREEFLLTRRCLTPRGIV